LKIRYRIVQEITAEGDWDTVGVIADWEAAPAQLRLNGIIAHTVSTPIWRIIGERVDERQLTLETYHQALGEYERYYRILPEIHTFAAETAAEIRRQMREKYVFKMEPALAQAMTA